MQKNKYWLQYQIREYLRGNENKKAKKSGVFIQVAFITEVAYENDQYRDKINQKQS